MNKDIIEGSWAELKGHAKQKWGELTDDDLTEIGGAKDRWVGALQKRYGYGKDHAENAIDELVNSVKHTFHRSD